MAFIAFLDDLGYKAIVELFLKGHWYIGTLLSRGLLYT